MNEKIWTSLLSFSVESDRIISEWLCDMPESMLHDIYGTRDEYVVSSERDLIGQSLTLDCAQLELVRPFVPGFNAEAVGCYFRIFTYFAADRPEVLPQGMQLRLEVYKKCKSGGNHFCDIELPLGMNLREVRRILCLPAMHNLVVDVRLRFEWQISYFRKYINIPSGGRYFYVFSSCDVGIGG